MSAPLTTSEIAFITGWTSLGVATGIFISSIAGFNPITAAGLSTLATLAGSMGAQLTRQPSASLVQMAPTAMAYATGAGVGAYVIGHKIMPYGPAACVGYGALIGGAIGYNIGKAWVGIGRRDARYAAMPSDQEIFTQFLRNVSETVEVGQASLGQLSASVHQSVRSLASAVSPI
jgi:hypothetical protein